MPVYQGRRKGTWRVTVYARGQQHESIVEGTKRDAKQHEAQERLRLSAAAAARSRALPRFYEFLRDEYRPHAIRHLGPNTWSSRKYLVAVLMKHLGRYRMTEVAAHVEEYKAARLAEGRRASTINNELRILRSIFRWVIREKRWALEVPSFRILPTLGVPRARAWTDEEVARLFASAETLAPHLVPLMTMLFNTGMRKGEVVRVEWSWVDWDRKLLRIPVTKTWAPKGRKPREVPLSDSVLEMLRSLPRELRFVFVARRGGTPYGRFPEYTFDEVRKAARVTGGIHHSRHTFASMFLRAMPDMKLLAEILGHSSTKITEVYAHMMPGHLERARGVVDLSPKTLAATLAAPSQPRRIGRKTA